MFWKMAFHKGGTHLRVFNFVHEVEAPVCHPGAIRLPGRREDDRNGILKSKINLTKIDDDTWSCLCANCSKLDSFKNSFSKRKPWTEPHVKFCSLSEKTNRFKRLVDRKKWSLITIRVGQYLDRSVRFRVEWNEQRLKQLPSRVREAVPNEATKIANLLLASDWVRLSKQSS